MKIGPRYKIARRLGVPIFEKTQTAKYALSLSRKERANKKRTKPKSEYGLQLLEKQKARFTYGLTEKQFRSYVDKSLTTSNPVQKLFSNLERRLDNVVFRAGLVKTRAQARQAASHGHLLVNGKKVTIPSIILKDGDSITLKQASANSPLFGESSERMKEITSVAWLKVDPLKKEIGVVGEPVYSPAEHVYDLGVVIEFYNR
ncbi:30S ribosomal protein S4 [Candidatus Parcubacteria bacterium]|nr:30S ribosomal protein S4 [Candidatus Parcubacteria bacterium]